MSTASAGSERTRLSLPFDQYQRYRMVAGVLTALRVESLPLKILDVGGAEGTILHFLPETDDVKILDQRDTHGVEGFVQGDATAMPFEDETFDYVASVDTYEHIPSEARDRYLSELRRVARKGVLLAGPFDTEGVREAEEVANGVHKTVHLQDNVWLKEHAENELPDLEEAREFFGGHGDNIAVLPNGYLPNWIAMICLVFYGTKLSGGARESVERLNAFYNEFVYEHDNVEPCYRYLILSLKKGELPDLGPFTSPARPQAAPVSALYGALASNLPLTAQLREVEERLSRKDGLLEYKDGLLSQKEVQIRDLARRLAAAETRRAESERKGAELGRQNARLNRQREQLTNSTTYRLLELISRVKNRAMRLGRRGNPRG